MTASAPHGGATAEVPSPRGGAIVLDFSLVAPGGAYIHARGFLGALAAMAAEGGRSDDLLVCLPGDAGVLAGEERDLRSGGVATTRIGSSRPAGSWRSRLGGQLALPRLWWRERPSVVFVPREVGPLLLPGRTVVLAANVLRWRRRADLDPLMAAPPSARVRAIAAVKTSVAGQAVRRASAVVAPSQVVAGLLPPVARVEVIPFGIDVAPAPLGEVPLGRRRPLRIVVVATVARHKRVDVVVDLVGELVERHGVDATLDVWGGWPDPELAQEIERRIAERLGDRGRLLGPLDAEARHDMLARSDVLVLGSGVESFGFPLLEAQRTATLVLAPDAPIVREQCGDRAVVYPAGDPVAGAARLAEVLDAESEQDLAERLRSGQEFASALTWERCVAATLALLRELGDRG